MMGIILRFKTAVALVLLGLLTLLAGIGQQTIWAPPETVTASVPAGGTAAPLTVFDEKLRTLHGGTVKINVKGEGSFMLAAGRPDDVAAWVGKTAHNTVSGLSADGKTLQLQHSDGEATAPSPAGSDLWVTTENANGELNYNWTPPADGDWSLLLAADGTKPAPSSISMTFPNDTSTPWAIPLHGARRTADPGRRSPAAAQAQDRQDARRRLRRPHGWHRRQPEGQPVCPPRTRPGRCPGQSPHRKRHRHGRTDTGTGSVERVAAGSAVRRAAGAAVALLTAAAVAGTGVAAQASQTPSPTPSGSSAAAATAAPAPVLLDAQFRSILEQVAGAVDAGDAAKDAAKLASRVGAAELDVRTHNYKIRSQVGSYEARMPVRATKLLTTVVSNKRAWPRSVLAVTQGDGNVVPQLLTLVQASPRENYKLVGATPLQPGTTFPGINRGGTETLAASDKSGLQYSGDEALAGLGDRLTTADSAFKDKLTEGQSSPYIADTLAYQSDVVKSGANGNFAFTHKVVPENTVVFRTADGGALVLGRLNFGLRRHARRTPATSSPSATMQRPWPEARRRARAWS